MKIYTRIDLDWNGKVLDEVSYKYDGPIVQCKGGTSAPEPTGEERLYYQQLGELVGKQSYQLGLQNDLLIKMWPAAAQLATRQGAFQLEMQPFLEDLQRQGVNIQALQNDLAEQGIDLQSAQMLSAKELLPIQTSLAKQGMDLQSMQIESAKELQPYLKDLAKQQTELETLKTQFSKDLLPIQKELAEQGIDLQSLQMKAMTEQIERNRALEPALLDAFGLKTNEDGQYVQAEVTDPIQQQLTDLYQRAITGEEPVSPALENQINKEKESLENELSQRLGDNWQTTTSGIQAMSEFDERANRVREESRRGMISTAGSQLMGYKNQALAEKAQNQASLLGLTSPQRATSTGMSMPTGANLLSGSPVGQTANTGTLAADQWSGYQPSIGSVSTPSTQIMSMGTNAGLLNSASFGETTGAIQGILGNLSNERWNAYQAKKGQEAGQTNAMMSGALTGAQIGSSFGGWGAGIGAGAGLLAGYLLS